ncbi:MAG: hypothetical protein JWN70_511 [Planctomycetaceae bacterium]|nr:hypothetical protein [Planctomycetaceae bacterium]
MRIDGNTLQLPSFPGFCAVMEHLVAVCALEPKVETGTAGIGNGRLCFISFGVIHGTYGTDGTNGTYGRLRLVSRGVSTDKRSGMVVCALELDDFSNAAHIGYRQLSLSTLWISSDRWESCTRGCAPHSLCSPGRDGRIKPGAEAPGQNKKEMPKPRRGDRNIVGQSSVAPPGLGSSRAPGPGATAPGFMRSPLPGLQFPSRVLCSDESNVVVVVCALELNA